MRRIDAWKTIGCKFDTSSLLFRGCKEVAQLQDIIRLLQIARQFGRNLSDNKDGRRGCYGGTT